MILQNTAPYRTVPHCTALYCTVLRCTVPYNIRVNTYQTSVSTLTGKPRITSGATERNSQFTIRTNLIIPSKANWTEVLGLNNSYVTMHFLPENSGLPRRSGMMFSFDIVNALPKSTSFTFGIGPLSSNRFSG